ncbi:DUF7127 family protein [Halorussus amylolyticus]|uniref:DUF7127 family protein n=1 Tax=Halorussus amylolyticus TaxID=1126242 RepID=UPI001044887A|nr:hypothetical protein [Halorussus amylolyticus]
MSLKRISEREDVFARHYEYDDEEVFVADFGAASDASIDVVGDVAIVVFDDDGDSRQIELELPEEGAEAFITNGVVTIEVEQ